MLFSPESTKLEITGGMGCKTCFKTLQTNATKTNWRFHWTTQRFMAPKLGRPQAGDQNVRSLLASKYWTPVLVWQHPNWKLQTWAPKRPERRMTAHTHSKRRHTYGVSNVARSKRLVKFTKVPAPRETRKEDNGYATSKNGHAVLGRRKISCSLLCAHN